MHSQLEAPALRRAALSVIVPVYNEAATLAVHMHELIRILDALPDRPTWELLLIEDGSSDTSLGAAMRLATEEARISVCMHDRNYGIARAMATGCAQASGEYIMVLDADLSYGPADIAALWARACASDADIILASAFMRGGAVRNVPPLRKYLSASSNWFLSLASCGSHATFTCMVRVYRASLLRELLPQIDPAALLPDLVFAALRRGARVVEVPATLAWRPQRRTQSRFRALASARYALAIIRCGLARRPALWLAVPGLIPGLLPAVVAAVVLLHFSHPLAAGIIGLTVAVQYASLSILGWQGVSFLSRRTQRC